MPKYQHVHSHLAFVEAVRISATVIVIRDGQQTVFIPGDWLTTTQGSDGFQPTLAFINDEMFREGFRPTDSVSRAVFDQTYPPQEIMPVLSPARTRSIQL